jgi:hypothetical protein
MKIDCAFTHTWVENNLDYHNFSARGGIRIHEIIRYWILSSLLLTGLGNSCTLIIS